MGFIQIGGKQFVIEKTEIRAILNLRDGDNNDPTFTRIWNRPEWTPEQDLYWGIGIWGKNHEYTIPDSDITNWFRLYLCDDCINLPVANWRDLPGQQVEFVDEAYDGPRNTFPALCTYSDEIMSKSKLRFEKITGTDLSFTWEGIARADIGEVEENAVFSVTGAAPLKEIELEFYDVGQDWEQFAHDMLAKHMDMNALQLRLIKRFREPEVDPIMSKVISAFYEPKMI